MSAPAVAELRPRHFFTGDVTAVPSISCHVEFGARHFGTAEGSTAASCRRPGQDRLKLGRRRNNAVGQLVGAPPMIHQCSTQGWFEDPLEQQHRGLGAHDVWCAAVVEPLCYALDDISCVGAVSRSATLPEASTTTASGPVAAKAWLNSPTGSSSQVGLPSGTSGSSSVTTRRSVS